MLRKRFTLQQERAIKRSYYRISKLLKSKTSIELAKLRKKSNDLDEI